MRVLVHKTGIAAALVICAGLAVSASEPDETILFSRADPVEVVTGQASLRRAYTARLALPQEECQGDPLSCTEDTIYGQVYSLEFHEERLHGSPDGSASTEQIDRGRILIALDFSPENEALLEEALVAHLAELSVASYARPQAAIRVQRDPLSQRVLAQSTLPAWVCTELDGDYRFDLIIAKEGKLRKTRSGSGEIAESACRTIQRATEGVQAETLRTIPSVRAQTRHTVRLQSISTLDGLRWADDLAEIPGEADLAKQSLDGERTGAMRDIQDGIYRGHEGRYHGVERDVLLPAESLQLLEVPMWVSRWTFESVHETFGRQTERTAEAPTTIVMAVLPVADPLMDDLTRTRTALFVPERELIEATLARIEKSAALDPSLVVKAFVTAELWPAQGDWMLVSCRDDGSARYGIAPFGDAAKVVNAQATCAAILREIGD